MVLHLHGVAYVDKFPILKDHEIVLFGKCFQALHSVGAKVRHDVNMRFEKRNVGAKLFLHKRVNRLLDIHSDHWAQCQCFARILLTVS